MFHHIVFKNRALYCKEGSDLWFTFTSTNLALVFSIDFWETTL